MHKFCFIGGMSIKFQSETKVNKTRKVTCHFIDNYIMLGNYDVMTDSSKSAKFL